MDAQIQEALDKLLEEVDGNLWASYGAALAGSGRRLE